MSLTLQQFNEFVKTIPSVNTLNYLHDKLGKKGVKVTSEKATDFSIDKPVYNRIFLGTFRRSCRFNFPGTILCKNGKDIPYKIISAPPAPPTNQYKISHLQKNFSDCTILKAHDGTTISLYYYNNKWVMSTHRGFEVNNYIWQGTQQYQTIVDEALSQYPQFKYSNLNKKKCYTIGFKHSEYHPFAEGREIKDKYLQAWFIRSVDLVKLNAGNDSYISYTDNIGIPYQKEVKARDVKDITQIAFNAYQEYVTNGVVNYGYLIRIGTRQHLIESSLLERIRHIFYSNKFNNLDKSFDKRKYIIVHSFLCAGTHDVFKSLFPQYNKDFVMLEKIIDELVDAIIKLFSDTEKKKIETVIDLAAVELYSAITDTLTIKTREKSSITSLLYSYIYNTRYTNLIYKLAYK